MQNKTFFKIGIIYFVAICFVAISFTLGYTGVITNEIWSAVLIQIVVMFAIPMLMYTIFISKNPKKTLSDTGFKKISAKTLLITICLGFVLYFLNQYIADIFSAIISLFGYERLPSSTTVKLDFQFLLKELILSCVLPAVCEEFLHRGILLHANKKSGNPRYCLFISSIIFGLVHLNINQFFYAAILGFLIGYVGLVSDSIFPCMIIHFMNNFLGTFLYYGALLKWPISSFVGMISDLIYSNAIILLVTMFISIPLLLYLYRVLVKALVKEKAKQNVAKVINELNIKNIPIEEAQAKLNQVNEILTSNLHQNEANQEKVKFTFKEKLFYITSIILGSLITISTFIWGLI